MKWQRHPTFSFPMRLGDKVAAAIGRRDARMLDSLGVVWFDWRISQWRRDNRGWISFPGWQSAPAYGGRVMIRATSPIIPDRPVYVGEHMPKLKVVPKATAAVEEVVEPKKAKKAKVAAKTGGKSKYTGVTTGLSVREYQNNLMAKNFKAKLTDEALATAMRREFPNAVPYTEEHVVGIRSAWNKGNHGNEKPANPLPQFDDSGKAMPIWGAKSAAVKAAKEAVAEAKAVKIKKKKTA